MKVSEQLCALLIAMFCLVGVVSGADVVPPRPDHLPRDVIADWEDQDRARKIGYDQAVKKVIAKLPNELRAPLERRLSQIANNEKAGFRELYLDACHLRRWKRMKGYLNKGHSLVFVKHGILGRGFFTVTEDWSYPEFTEYSELFVKFLKKHRKGALCQLNLDSLYPVEKELVGGPGMIRDPDVSPDGSRVLFAWKKSRDDDYHLYEYKLASGSVRQLTYGKWADFDGIYLPDNNIVFTSTRCVQGLDCWYNPVSNLFTCDEDGRFIRRLGFDQVNTAFPTLLPDGRVLYMRWDYNDRGHTYTKSLFTMRPDGTHQMEYYGNNSWFPPVYNHPCAIPGSQKVLVVVGPYHGMQSGKLVMLDIRKGRQEDSALQLIAPRRKFGWAKGTWRNSKRMNEWYGKSGDQFAYPCPLSDEAFVVSYRPARRRRWGRDFGLYFMTVGGERELLCRDPRGSAHAVMLTPRQIPQLVNAVDYRRKQGLFTIEDVYKGEGLKGVPRGTIKALRVVALRYRAFSIGWSTHTGPGEINCVGVSYTCPIAAPNGAWDVKEVLGTSKVQEDGSAAFFVPARTPVYFQALDANNRVVQTMRSWATLMPGETFSCIGCHEDKNAVAASTKTRTLAMARGPEQLQAFYDVRGGFSFTKVIQPILDRRCTGCHNGESKLDLRNNPVRLEKTAKSWNSAYLNLIKSGTVNWMGAGEVPTVVPPRHAGSIKSKLSKMLQQGHSKVKLTQEEFDKINCWIDLAVPHSGEYSEGMNEEDAAKYARWEKLRAAWEAEERKNIKGLLMQK